VSDEIQALLDKAAKYRRSAQLLASAEDFDAEDIRDLQARAEAFANQIEAWLQRRAAEETGF